MIVAVRAVRMVSMIVYDIVRVIAVPDRGVAAIPSVLMVLPMRSAGVIRRADILSAVVAHGALLHGKCCKGETRPSSLG